MIWRKEYNIQNSAKVWNQERIVFLQREVARCIHILCTSPARPTTLPSPTLLPWASHTFMCRKMAILLYVYLNPGRVKVKLTRTEDGALILWHRVVFVQTHGPFGVTWCVHILPAYDVTQQKTVTSTTTALGNSDLAYSSRWHDPSRGAITTSGPTLFLCLTVCSYEQLTWTVTVVVFVRPSVYPPISARL